VLPRGAIGYRSSGNPVPYNQVNDADPNGIPPDGRTMTFTPSIERELTTRVSLTRPDGGLNPDAVGWSRVPLHDTAGIPGRGSWGRNKRWEYWNVMSPSYIVALTVSCVDYMSLHEIWVLDRATGETVGTTAISPGGRSAQLPASLGEGPARARTGRVTIDIDEAFDGTRLRGSTSGVSFDILATRPPSHDSLAVVVPWRRGGEITRFQYTVKDVARPATGTVTLDGIAHDVPVGSWAVLDHGRGRWPYDVRWNWGAGGGVSGDRVIGLQVGGKWTDGTGATENAVFVDGVLHKISEDLRWDYDLARPLRPWRVHGGGLDATLTPFHDKHSARNLGILSARTHQCFGVWAGTFDGLAFEGIEGFAEDVHNRW